MENDIINSLKVLLNGGIILYPTDTIWGLGCDATNKAAIERVYEIKRRQDK
ncbi:MAG: Sua5/YciO/YrdC/YwlC family protein, partial [Bacteroidales bacterium]|nr:Sua5/YciO/YrdC/YwlC family protein [Bacteroidales bacterium]